MMHSTTLQLLEASLVSFGNILMNQDTFNAQKFACAAQNCTSQELTPLQWGQSSVT